MRQKQILDEVSINFLLPTTVDWISFCGVHDSNLRCIERICNIKIHPKPDGNLFLKGESASVLLGKKILDTMIKSYPHSISHRDIEILAEKLKNTSEIRNTFVISKHTKIKPYTKNQAIYLEKISMNDICFGVGPAGTGKTYLAVAMALQELKAGTVKRIILTRPVVETDEHLGFLPGTLEEKIDPYVRPLYDALQDLLSPQEFEKLNKSGQIELAPLAYMRGRTLANSFVILDEAQNSTLNQMKMFLTRLGQNSKMVITGDISQIDLQKKQSGLLEAITLLKKIPEIGIHYFEADDSVRHGLVKKIINAYDGEFRSEEQ